MKTQTKTRHAPLDSPMEHSDVNTESAPQRDSVRDTIESVVVAFIMAFVFRAFIVEAFIIPTGSMAASLNGMHGQHRCPQCGYPFAYGIRQERSGIQRSTLANTFSVRCPNCSWDGEGNNKLNQTDDPVVANAGDRILVLKWPYDIGGDWLGPQRWDVVVFKDPEDGETNFIKRLIGRPGEVLEIINGDIYTAPASSVRSDILKALSFPPTSDPNRRRLNQEQTQTLAKVLKIQRKTPVAQSSLWMIHYDHDYIPRKRQGRSAIFYDPPYWDEESSSNAPAAWNATKPVVYFQPAAGDHEKHWLVLKGKPIRDNYGYNSVNYRQYQQDQSRDVGDVRLKFVLFPGKGDGGLILRLTKGNDQFRARILSDGSVFLERQESAGIWIGLKPMIKSLPLSQGQPHDIEFENLDYRVTLRIDGNKMLWTDDDQYPPNLSDLLKQPYQDGRNNKAGIAIGAWGMPMDIRHLQVHRDIFYRSPRIPGVRGQFTPYENCPGWATATNPIYLRTDPPDYFCCGDNSPQSKDGRLWVDVCPMLSERKNYQFGTVPGDQLIGRAFFVYWPNGLRLTQETPAIIPNVGRMRIIR